MICIAKYAHDTRVPVYWLVIITKALAEDAIPVSPLWAEAGQSLGEDFCSARLVSTCYGDYLFVWQCDARVEILDVSVIPPLVRAIVDANYMVPGEVEGRDAREVEADNNSSTEI